jgi:hypothetical protein
MPDQTYGGGLTIRPHKDDNVPLVQELAAIMPEAMPLIDRLATEFALLPDAVETPQAYWLALNGWMTDRLSGPILDGQVTAREIGEQAWAVYASSIWGGMELRANWGMPPRMQEMGLTLAPPFPEVQQTIRQNLARRLDALAGGGPACLEILPSLMWEEMTTGTVYGLAYNAGVQVVKTEDPPIGQRRPHRAAKPAAVRINRRDFMRVDYDLPTPRYLRTWRSAFERAVGADEQGFERIIAGGGGDADLRDIWKRAVAYGNTTWGGDSNDKWTQAYFDATIHWSSVLNFGLEAVGLAAFVAVLNQDPEAATRAVLGNALYVGATAGWLIGLLDTDGVLPSVVSA